MQCRRQFSWYRYRLCHPLGRFSRPYPNMIPNLFTSTLHVQESTALLSTLPVSPFTLADLNHPRTSLDHRGTSLISSFLLHGPIRSPISRASPALQITTIRFPFATLTFPAPNFCRGKGSYKRKKQLVHPKYKTKKKN